MAISDWPGNVVRLIRDVDQLLNANAKHGKAIEKLFDEIGALKERVTRLETREDVILEKARSAAGTAAPQVAIASVSDISRRIGMLEARSGPQRLDLPT